MTVKSMLIRIGGDPSGLDTAFKKADGMIQRNAQKFKKAGRVITVAGGAIVGALALATMKASDLQETTAKFGTVFGPVFKEASQASKDLAANYGLSSLASKDMMGATGDLLTGLGMGADAALGLSTRTQELAVDLASFTNFSGGAKGASEALTKAMLGERESVKALGIVVTEEMVKEQLLSTGKSKLTGQALLQAKAEATLLIAVSQSKNAIGDYSRTSDSLANKKRLLMARIEDLTAKIGAVLIPIVTKLMSSVTKVTEKVGAWMDAHPKLAGVIIKVVGVIGVLMTILGPLLIMLPALSAGFAILWGAITGPVGLVIAAVAAVAGAVFLIYKNWDKIKGFFIKLWESVAGFFTNAFNGIKKKVLDWAISIAAILAKIPIVKKLAGPWKESLETMRAELDATKIAIRDTSAVVTEEGLKMGQALIDAVKGSRAFSDAQAVLKEETGLLGKASGLLKIGLDAINGAYSKTKESAENTAKAYVVANEKITSLTLTMTDEIKKATLSEYEYAKWALAQKLQERIIAIGEEKAAEDEKNTAIALAKGAFRSEQKALDKAHAETELERQETLTKNWKEVWGTFWEALKTKQASYLTAKAGLTDSINALTKSELDCALTALLDEKMAREAAWEDELAGTDEYEELLLLSAEEYAERKKEILADAAEKIQKKEEEVAAATAAAWRETFDSIVACVTTAIGSIDAIFGQLYENTMIRIDNEEKRRLEAIDTHYNATIEANKALVEAEKAKTKEVLESITNDYNKKREYILANVTDEEERAEMLADLEKQHEETLAQARIDREEAERATAETLKTIEETKNEALRLASEELEGKREKARRTAARQEKAVALLSAIVNTATGVTKALASGIPPWNIILAAITAAAGAVQISLIKSQPIPLKEGGIVMSRTPAIIGEAGAEAVIPLNKLSSLGLAPGPISFKQTNYFYGDINNVGDLDEISKRLAERTRRSIERGRK